MKSIIQTKKECFKCLSCYNLEEHHVFFGSANRKLSEQDGLKVWLCYEHHRGTYGVHGRDGKKIDTYLKEQAEQVWIVYYGKTEDDFRKIYGKNYL